ncbi:MULTISPECIES: hypothetical protein [unclassified Synechococcus]|uniref:hypothetical protein n=1 Tax=unclassified Synechococcus TaxID=2626047 RepID=UPI0014827FA2|nr:MULTISPECIES: hypothetical protein [unclassified Synechococcus]
MLKEDWIRLAMPAAITLLAAAIIVSPFTAKAQLDGATVHVKQAWGDRWDINDCR